MKVLPLVSREVRSDWLLRWINQGVTWGRVHKDEMFWDVQIETCYVEQVE